MTNRRKVGMTSSHHALMSRATHVLHWRVQRDAIPRGSKSHKARLGSDWRLKLASRKVELLVIADQQRRGEGMSRALYTPPSHHESGQHPKPVA